MRISHKPVRKCHSCRLNLGDHCWLYPEPRLQWRGGRTCHALDDEAIHREFELWQKQPRVKTRRELRREFFRSKRREFQPRREKRRRGANLSS